MNYTVYSASGRTGSWRLCQMISSSYKNFNATVTWNNPEDEHFCYHTHDSEFAVKGQAILSTRKDKTNIVLSYLIAKQCGFIHQSKCPPFKVDIPTYIAHTEDLLKKEKDFLNKHNNAIEIYVEDSIEDIESKLNIVLAYKHNDTKYISINKAADVIENYSEIRAIAAHYNIA